MAAPPDDATAAVLMPERHVRALLGSQRLRLRILRPPYASLGVGTLRVLRIREADDRLDVVAGYDRYERLPGVAR